MLRNKTILCFYNSSLHVLSGNKSQSVFFKIVSPGKYFRCLAKFCVKNKVQYYNINQHLKYLMIDLLTHGHLYLPEKSFGF